MKQKTQDLQPGARFVAFRIDRLIGRGGIGVVYEVTYQHKKYALKVVPCPEWVETEKDVNELKLEGDVMMWLKHPHIVEVHDTGVTADKENWIRMELLQGETLRERLHRKGPLSVPMACAVATMIARGLHAAHLRGITHRDVKPENMFLTDDFIAKLLDFGIMKLYGNTQTKDGYIKGTPLYMAPEQIRGMPASPATDVYSLGIATIEAVWRHPYVKNLRAYDVDAVLKAHLNEVPRFPEDVGIPKEVDDVLAKAVAKLPEQRYQTALDFGNAIYEASQRAQARDSAIDTRPCEPQAVELALTPGDGVRFGTGPVTRETVQANVTVDAQASGTGTVQADVPAGARPAYAKTEELPAPDSVVPRADTVRLPDTLRDPTCIFAEQEGRRPVQAEAAPDAGWVPVQTTIRLSPALLKASAMRFPVPAQAAAVREELEQGAVAREEPDPLSSPRPRSGFAARWFTVVASSAVAGIMAGTIWMYISPVPPGIHAPVAEANVAEEVEGQRLKVESSGASAAKPEGELPQGAPGASLLAPIASAAPVVASALPASSTVVAASIAGAPGDKAAPAPPAQPRMVTPKPPPAPKKARFLTPERIAPPKKPAPSLKDFPEILE